MPILIKYKHHPLLKELKLVERTLLKIMRFINEVEKMHKDSAVKLNEMLQSYTREVKERRLREIPVEKLKDFGVKRVPWANLKAYGVDDLKTLKDMKPNELLLIPGVGKATVKKNGY